MTTTRIIEIIARIRVPNLDIVVIVNLQMMNKGYNVIVIVIVIVNLQMMKKGYNLDISWSSTLGIATADRGSFLSMLS